ncbi:MAG: hypothetical protein Q8R83_11200 [Legionellaceae bacterium]|nr:hypothetical protein [Legionellaceae bacterium]
MTKFIKLSGSYQQIMTVLDLPSFLATQSLDDYETTLSADSNRTNIVVFNEEDTESIRRELFDASSTKADRGHYTQGDYDAAVLRSVIVKTKQYVDDPTNEKIVRFAYRDDSIPPVFCGFSIIRVGVEPNAHHMITLIRNVTAAPKDRQVLIFCDTDLFDWMPQDKGINSLVADDTIDESHLLNTIADHLGSKKIQELLSPLFSTGSISEEAFKQLGDRLSSRALDDRDNRRKIFNQLLEIARKLKPDFAQKLEESSKVDINFFEKEQFNQLFYTVTAMVNEQQGELSTNLCHALHIEYQASIRYQDHEPAYQFLIDKANEIKNNKTPIQLMGIESYELQFWEETIKNQIGILNDLFENCSIKQLKDKMHIVLKDIEALQKQNALNLDQQKFIFTLVNEWCNYIKKPSSQGLNDLESKYREIAPLSIPNFKDLKSVLKIRELLQEASSTLSKPNAGPYNFDPQGRVLFVDSNNIVSVDIKNSSDLETKYNKCIGDALEEVKQGSSEGILELLKALPNKNSIIPLQEELYFHLALTTRLYGAFPEMTQSDQSKNLLAAHQQTMNEVNKLVMKAFARALLAAKQGDNLNLKILNQQLDKARADITSEAHDILLANIRTKTGVNCNVESVDINELREVAKKVTASPAAIIHVDNHLGLVTQIEGSKYTSHDRRKGAEFAHRSITTYQLDNLGQIESKIDRVQIRIPSLALKEGLKEKAYIDDVKDKLNHLVTRYELKGAFTYNLFTALHDNVDLFAGNAQTQSTRHIILGAHEYNREQVNSPNKSYCFVEAISVNGFGSPPGYYRFGFRTVLRNEATLMAEMALLNQIDSSRFTVVQNEYETFLKREKPSFLGRLLGYDTPYFVKTNQGNQAKTIITQWKNECQQSIDQGSETDHKLLALSALKKIMAFDLHFSHDYAKLIQSLSLFVEKQSVFGCKSGNERTPIICERAQLLDQKNIPQAVTNAFQVLANATNKQAAKAAADSLKSAMDNLYNDENTYGATSRIPLLDQAAGHKIKAKTGAWDIDRNHAEELTITNLQQKNTGDMQAHRGLVDYMIGASAKSSEKIHQTETDKPVDDGICGSYTMIQSVVGGASPNELRSEADTASVTDGSAHSLDSDGPDQVTDTSKKEVQSISSGPAP